jgi:hypothetical protein
VVTVPTLGQNDDARKLATVMWLAKDANERVAGFFRVTKIPRRSRGTEWGRKTSG